jgi:hypothetical protein
MSCILPAVAGVLINRGDHVMYTPRNGISGKNQPRTVQKAPRPN